MLSKRNLMLCLLIIFVFSTTSFPFDIRSIHIDSLYKNSVFVGIVRVVEGKLIENFGCKYKAEILTCLKGDSTKYLEFGEYGGVKIGWEYLVFLSRESENINDCLIVESDDNDIEDTIPNNKQKIKLQEVLYIKYAGFGLMPIDYSIEATDYAIDISTSYVLMPKSIKRYAYLSESSNICGRYYFKKDDIVTYLKLLQK